MIENTVNSQGPFTRDARTELGLTQSCLTSFLYLEIIFHTDLMASYLCCRLIIVRAHEANLMLIWIPNVIYLTAIWPLTSASKGHSRNGDSCEQELSSQSSVVHLVFLLGLYCSLTFYSSDRSDIQSGVLLLYSILWHQQDVLAQRN